MLHFKTKSEIIIDGLQARINQIRVVAESLKLIDPLQRNYTKFYKEVAFFVHAILSSTETSKLFINLIEYKNNLKTDQEFNKLIASIEFNVSEVARLIKNHPEFDKLKNGSKHPYFNPVLSYPKVTLPLDELLTSFEIFKVSNGNYDDYLSKTGKILEKILSECSVLGVSNLEDILKSINSYHDKINTFDYYTNFQCDFNGSASATNISLIYTNFNPVMSFNGDFYQTLLLDNINKGKTISGEENLETLLNDCDKVFQYLKQQLNSQLAIESYIDRFTTYISLYYKVDFQLHTAEVDLQEKFQEFIFNAGYYPISEAELKDGRLDTIAGDHSNAFLFEIKQFDLAGTKEKDNDLIKKIRSAQVQSSIYIDRLKTFPNLAHFVFIIVFTNRKVSFLNNLDRVVKDGITYILKSITVYDKSPSQVKTDVQININDLINSTRDGKS